MEETVSKEAATLEQKTNWLLLSNTLVGNLLAGTACPPNTPS
jgi:hypothetical protein